MRRRVPVQNWPDFLLHLPLGLLCGALAWFIGGGYGIGLLAVVSWLFERYELVERAEIHDTARGAVQGYLTGVVVASSALALAGRLVSWPR